VKFASSRLLFKALIDLQIKWSCIVPKAFILFTDAKDEKATGNFGNTVVRSPQRKTKFTHFFS